jgi:hypothetical protein
MLIYIYDKVLHSFQITHKQVQIYAKIFPDSNSRGYNFENYKLRVYNTSMIIVFNNVYIRVIYAVHVNVNFNIVNNVTRESISLLHMCNLCLYINHTFSVFLSLFLLTFRSEICVRNLLFINPIEFYSYRLIKRR